MTLLKSPLAIWLLLVTLVVVLWIVEAVLVVMPPWSWRARLVPSRSTRNHQ
jgi:hypothetical protein